MNSSPRLAFGAARSVVGAAGRAVPNRRHEKQLLVNDAGVTPIVDRYKLHFRPYHAPPFEYGAKVDCWACGQVRIVRQSNTPIASPEIQPAIETEAAAASKSAGV